MSDLSGLQERIARMMVDGASVDSVEREAIARSDLNSEQKAAAWLYAWSLSKARESPERPMAPERTFRTVRGRTRRKVEAY
jgi:hypothetical protein